MLGTSKYLLISVYSRDLYQQEQELRFSEIGFDLTLRAITVTFVRYRATKYLGFPHMKTPSKIDYLSPKDGDELLLFQEVIHIKQTFANYEKMIIQIYIQSFPSQFIQLIAVNDSSSKD